MIHHLLIAALLTADPTPDAGRPGEFDSPVLIDLPGRIDDLSDGAAAIEGCFPVKTCLPAGTTCLTYDKAASIRDDLAAKNARVASLETSLSTNWPLVVIVAGLGVLAAGAAAAGGYIAGQASAKR